MSTGGFNPLLAAGDMVGGAVSMVGNFASNIGKGFASMFTPKPQINTQIMQPMGSANYWDNLAGQAETLRTAQRTRFIAEETVAGNVASAALARTSVAPSFWDSLGNIAEQALPAVGEALYNKYLADDLSRYTGNNPPETLEQPGPEDFVGPPPPPPADFWSKILGVKPNQPGGYSVGYAPQSAGISKASLPALAIAGVIILLLLRKK